MSETEADARRLLTAATEDMPPGIDLLDGFPAARRRDKIRRTRRSAVLSAGIAAAASVTAVTLTIGSAPPSRATVSTVTTAMTRTLAQSYRLTEQTSMYYLYSGKIRYPSHGTCTSQEDPVRHLAAYSGSECPGERVVGGYVYLYIEDPIGEHGRHWERIPTADLGHLPLSSPTDEVQGATPQHMLSQLRQVTKVTVTGPVSGPGWTGTRYAFARSLGGPGRSGQKISGTVDVDQQGRARALIMTTRFTAGDGTVLVTTQNLTFSDFGARVIVTPPPADQVFPGP